MSKATPKIFISYYRADTSGHAAHLASDLKNRFGEGSVFIDIHTIAPGADFRRTIETAINDCDVLLAVIGPTWLSIIQKERPETDWARVEIASALKREILVIPLLVQGAGMPVEGSLPDDLKELTYRNALDISDKHWERDVNELIASLKGTVSKRRAGTSRIEIFFKTSWLRISVTLFAVLAVITTGIFFIGNQITQESPPSRPEAAPTLYPGSADANIQVWVNTDPKSNTYHCPGTPWYGKTRAGEYMSQGEAQRLGYQPAYGKVCH